MIIRSLSNNVFSFSFQSSNRVTEILSSKPPIVNIKEYKSYLYFLLTFLALLLGSPLLSFQTTESTVHQLTISMVWKVKKYLRLEFLFRDWNKTQSAEFSQEKSALLFWSLFHEYHYRGRCLTNDSLCSFSASNETMVLYFRSNLVVTSLLWRLHLNLLKRC